MPEEWSEVSVSLSVTLPPLQGKVAEDVGSAFARKVRGAGNFHPPR